MSPSSLILLFLLYNAYYLKSLIRLSIVSLVKRGATVATQSWVIPQNHFFFKIKIKAGNVEKVDQEGLKK